MDSAFANDAATTTAPTNRHVKKGAGKSNPPCAKFLPALETQGVQSPAKLVSIIIREDRRTDWEEVLQKEYHLDAGTAQQLMSCIHHARSVNASPSCGEGTCQPPTTVATPAEAIPEH